MAFDKDFKPVLRFLVVSDVHYSDDPECIERKRMTQALKTAYELSEKEEYLCEINLDEDEVARFYSDSHYNCPYYRNGDEYKVVRHQM